MFCPHCGGQMRDDAQFCPQCGTEVPAWVAEGVQGGAQNAASMGSDAGCTRLMNQAVPQTPQPEQTIPETVAAPAVEAPQAQEQQPEPSPNPESRPRKHGGALKVAAVVILIAAIAGGVAAASGL